MHSDKNWKLKNTQNQDTEVNALNDLLLSKVRTAGNCVYDLFHVIFGIYQSEWGRMERLNPTPGQGLVYIYASLKSALSNAQQNI